MTTYIFANAKLNQRKEIQASTLPEAWNLLKQEVGDVSNWQFTDQK
jgi:hypothetical protein